MRLQHSTTAILFRLFTLWVFYCGFVAVEGNASSISSEVILGSNAVSTAISVYSSHSAQVNSSSENGKYKIYLRSALGMIFPCEQANNICL